MRDQDAPISTPRRNQNGGSRGFSEKVPATMGLSIRTRFGHVLLVDQIAGRVTWFSGIATTITIIDISGPESVDGSTAGEKGYA